MIIQPLRQCVSSELQAVDTLIVSSLESKVETVNQIGHYIVNSGGKRIRPLVVLLSSKACNAQSEEAITMATIIEFIHTATLLHDDVVDRSLLRRGKPTANAVWDNASAVLVGDFIYSRAFQMIARLKNSEATEILAETTNVIAEGEVLQLTHRQQPDISEAQYLRVIEYKTAKLFEAACQLGAVLGNQSRTIKQMLASYGKHIGIAFQLVDDLLDYQGDNPDWGKNIGDDLAEGKATLPLIYGMQHGDAALVDLIKNAILNKGSDKLVEIQSGIVSCGAIDYTMRLASEAIRNAKQALTLLPDTDYKAALNDLADFIVARNY